MVETEKRPADKISHPPRKGGGNASRGPTTRREKGEEKSETMKEQMLYNTRGGENGFKTLSFGGIMETGKNEERGPTLVQQQRRGRGNGV